MSKEPDKDPGQHASEDTPRRRRRRGGLRVPSDDVPRDNPVEASAEHHEGNGAASQTGAAEDEVTSAPVPDDAPTPAEVPPIGHVEDAIPIFQDVRPVVQARAITQEVLATTPDDDDAAEDEHWTDPKAGSTQNSEHLKTVKMTALPFSGDSSVPDEADDEDSVDIPIEEDEPVAPASVGTPRPQRAATLALSDDDLEELLESSEMLEELRPGAKAASKREPHAEVTKTPAPTDDHAEVEASPAKVAEVGDEAALVSDEEVTVDAEPPLSAPSEEADSSDSGEILEDDMLEEVAEPDAEAAEAPHPPPTPPPAPKPSPAVRATTPHPPPTPPDATPTTPRPRKSKPWFEEIFDEDYLRTLPFLTPQATQAEALFVADTLAAAPGDRLLDVGCGYGRHAMELAARGYQVVALDLSLPLLLRGADEAQRRGLGINFVHGDMRELSFDGQFEGAYCLFSTFGYFDDETNRKTLEGIARALKPNGRVTLEVLNRDYLIADLPTRVWWEGDGCVVLEEVDFNYFTSRIESNRSVVFDDGRQIEQEISIRAYSLHELGKVLHSVGLRVIEVSGSTATRNRFFGNQSREIIIVAEKRAGNSDGDDDAPLAPSLVLDTPAPVEIDEI
ncbi:class I SAM-dependent methyltransferase [Haliangium sp.]|uniref:class I SAM-dependent methyltransferase n=1 Tax=Haliangium sp. TaxID=2663208 RepID=UPI003D14B35F